MRHMPLRARGKRAVLTAAVAAALVTGCDDLEPGGSSAGSGPDAAPGRAVSPLANPDGTKPGLAALTSEAELPVTAADKAMMLKQCES